MYGKQSFFQIIILGYREVKEELQTFSHITSIVKAEKMNACWMPLTA